MPGTVLPTRPGAVSLYAVARVSTVGGRVRRADTGSGVLPGPDPVPAADARPGSRDAAVRDGRGARRSARRPRDRRTLRTPGRRHRGRPRRAERRAGDADGQREEPRVHGSCARTRTRPRRTHAVRRSAGRADQRPGSDALRDRRGLRRRIGHPVHGCALHGRAPACPRGRSLGRADDPGHVSLRPAHPRERPLACVLRVPRTGRSRRGPRVPRRLREPRRARPPPTLAAL